MLKLVWDSDYLLPNNVSDKAQEVINKVSGYNEVIGSQEQSQQTVQEVNLCSKVTGSQEQSQQTVQEVNLCSKVAGSQAQSQQTVQEVNLCSKVKEHRTVYTHFSKYVMRSQGHRKTR